MKCKLAFSLMLVVALLGGCNKGGNKAATNPLPTPEETVTAYCDLDASGARLSSTTWQKVLPYIAWTEEAGWDRTIVISGFRIAQVVNTTEKAATLKVEYQVLGSLSDDYRRERKTEAVKFTVRKGPAGWKITSPDFMPPHVKLEPLVKHLEETKNLELARKAREGEKP